MGRDQGDRVLAVLVELDRPDDGVPILCPLQLLGDLGAVRPELLDGVDHEMGRDVGEGAVRLRGLLEIHLGVGLEEFLAARQLLRGRPLDKAVDPLGACSGRLDESVGLDPRGPLELGLDRQLVHLNLDPDAVGGQPAVVDHLGLLGLDLGQLGRVD